MCTNISIFIHLCFIYKIKFILFYYILLFLFCDKIKLYQPLLVHFRKKIFWKLLSIGLDVQYKWTRTGWLWWKCWKKNNVPSYLLMKVMAPELPCQVLGSYSADAPQADKVWGIGVHSQSVAWFRNRSVSHSSTLAAQPLHSVTPWSWPGADGMGGPWTARKTLYPKWSPSLPWNGSVRDLSLCSTLAFLIANVAKTTRSSYWWWTGSGDSDPALPYMGF